MDCDVKKAQLIPGKSDPNLIATCFRCSVIIKRPNGTPNSIQFLSNFVKTSNASFKLHRGFTLVQFIGIELWFQPSLTHYNSVKYMNTIWIELWRKKIEVAGKKIICVFFCPLPENSMGHSTYVYFRTIDFWFAAPNSGKEKTMKNWNWIFFYVKWSDSNCNDGNDNRRASLQLISCL